MERKPTLLEQLDAMSTGAQTTLYFIVVPCFLALCATAVLIVGFFTGVIG